MKSLKKIVGEMVVATACGIATGAAIGYSIEAYRESKHEKAREKNPNVISSEYEKNRGTIVGIGVLGGAAAFMFYIFTKDKKKEGEEREPQ